MSIIDFPYFQIENRDETCGPVYAFDPKMLRGILEKCGFTVVRMPVRTKNIPGMFDTLTGDERLLTHFGVILPEGWHRSYRYVEHGESVEDLLDDTDRYRGWVAIGKDGIPIIGELFCRYAFIGNPFVHEIPVEPPEQAGAKLWMVVIDRSVVDYREPNRYPVVVYHDVRWPVAIDWPMELRMRYARLQGLRQHQRRLEGKPPDWHPVLRWLNEHYPRWQDPAAYWKD